MAYESTDKSHKKWADDREAVRSEMRRNREGKYRKSRIADSKRYFDGRDDVIDGRAA